MKLLIVETPGESQKIQEILGDEYKVVNPKWPIFDWAACPKEPFGIDFTNFKLSYIFNKNSENNKIAKLAKEADEVLLATQPDYEGEAIAYYLIELFNLKPDTKRLEIHEVTHDAIMEAIRQPRTVDKRKVDSYEARVIIDRIFGRLLCDFISNNGDDMEGVRGIYRTATPLLKLVVDREKEIQDFKPEKYQFISAKLKKDNVEIEAPLYEYKREKVQYPDKNLANKIVSDAKASLEIEEIFIHKKTIKPRPLYGMWNIQKDTQLQLDSSQTLSAARVSRTLDELYEGVKIDGQYIGLITYPRTNEPFLSEQFVKKAREYIKERFGEEYLSEADSSFILKESSMFTGEAIRPTSIHRTPNLVKPYLTNFQSQLYELIYNRTLGFLMKNKEEEYMEVIFGSDEEKYRFVDKRTSFKGFDILSNFNETANFKFNPTKGDKFDIVNIVSSEKTREKPERYTEPNLIKISKDLGIVGDATRSSVVSTLQNQYYVVKEKGFIVPTDIGKQIIDYLEKKFKDVNFINLASDFNREIDRIADGEVSKETVIKTFLNFFIQMLGKAQRENSFKCPKCGSPLVRVFKESGCFMVCSNWFSKKCDYTQKKEKSEVVYLDKKCPKCGRQLVKRVNKKGKTFVACSGFPECNYLEGKTLTHKNQTIIKKCPDCKDGNLVMRKGWDKEKKQIRYFLGCTNYPRCRHIEEYNPANTQEKKEK